jgi:hypothetical protein
MTRSIRSLIVPTAAIAMVGLLGACYPEDSTSQGAAAQEDVMTRALAEVPVPTVEQFTTRQTVARWVETANNPDQTHYVYAMLPGVGYVGYYVADSAPVNICVSLTPPQRYYRGNNSNYQLGAAPALDGVYYGGSGCDMWYFFDASTGAKIEMGGQMAFFTTNLPLDIDVPRLSMRVVTEDE